MTTVSCDRKISNNMINDGYPFPLVSAYSGGRQRETCFDDMQLSAERDKYFDDMRLSTQRDKYSNDMRLSTQREKYFDDMRLSIQRDI